jgi:ABC-type sugar transport system permease subunit
MFVDMKGYQLDTMKWNNFATFKEVFRDETFWQSLRRTLLLLSTQFIGLLIAMVTSTLLSWKLPRLWKNWLLWAKNSANTSMNSAKTL